MTRKSITSNDNRKPLEFPWKLYQQTSVNSAGSRKNGKIGKNGPVSSFLHLSLPQPHLGPWGPGSYWLLFLCSACSVLVSPHTPAPFQHTHCVAFILDDLNKEGTAESLPGPFINLQLN